MMKKIKINMIVKFVAFWLIFALLFNFFSRLICLKWLEGETTNTSTWEEFESLDENSLDVLFVGTSHVYSGIDPFYIYENSGITSFVLANGSARTDEVYIMLDEAFKTQSPKVVIMDVSVLHYTTPNEESKIHRVYDQISDFNPEKIKELNRSDAEEINLWDFMIPILRYHARWTDLKKNDFKYATYSYNAAVTRGHYINYDVVEVEKFDYFDEEQPEFEITDIQKESYEKIVDLCEEKGCELILTKIPNPDWKKSYSEKIGELAEETGVEYIEMLDFYEELGIDLHQDFRDKANHLNEYGAQKVSQYFTEYLTENEDFEDKRGKDSRWDQDLETYKEYKQSVYDKYMEKEAE